MESIDQIHFFFPYHIILVHRRYTSFHWLKGDTLTNTSPFSAPQKLSVCFEIMLIFSLPLKVSPLEMLYYTNNMMHIRAISSAF